MTALSGKRTVGEMVRDCPALSRVFESLGIDYCGCGKKTLEAACRQKGLRLPDILRRLEAVVNYNPAADDAFDLEGLTPTELADHILCIHHDYLRRELPRLEALIDKVAAAYAGRDRRLLQIRDVFAAMFSEMSSHMWKEEQILFPAVRRLDAGEWPTEIRYASMAHSIRQMESEHDDLASALERLQVLTDNYAPPGWSCNSYRVMLHALSCLQRDMRVHIHKENNVLFPGALELEAQRGHRFLACSGLRGVHAAYG